MGGHLVSCNGLGIVVDDEQKWSKGKQKEKVNNMVLFDQATYDKLLTEAPKYKLITPSILSDRMRVCIFFLLFYLIHSLDLCMFRFPL